MGKRKAFDPWERTKHPDYEYRSSPEQDYYFEHLAKKRPKFIEQAGNDVYDFTTKRAALKASASVVALVSYTGEEQLCQGCGVIIEADEHNVITVVTSANLIRRPTKKYVGENNLADNLKVDVYPSDYNSYEGEICAHDFHYNLLVIKFKADISLPVASLRTIDDGSTLRLDGGKSFELRPHSDCVKLRAGDTVIAVGRYFTKPFDFMVSPGCFSLDRCGYDCKELFVTTCNLTRCGDGCPLVNLSGEVIGINFYDLACLTPFLPMNIVLKWWDHYKVHRELRHPYLGFDAANLYVADVQLIERVMRSVPIVSDGVIVERVIPESSAHSAGLQQDDVIIKCNGKTVESFLKLWDLIWAKVGGTVELLVVRADCSTLSSISMIVVEATPDKMNSWARWEL